MAFLLLGLSLFASAPVAMPGSIRPPDIAVGPGSLRVDRRARLGEPMVDGYPNSHPGLREFLDGSYSRHSTAAYLSGLTATADAPSPLLVGDPGICVPRVAAFPGASSIPTWQGQRACDGHVAPKNMSPDDLRRLVAPRRLKSAPKLPLPIQRCEFITS